MGCESGSSCKSYDVFNASKKSYSYTISEKVLCKDVSFATDREKTVYL